MRIAWPSCIGVIVIATATNTYVCVCDANTSFVWLCRYECAEASKRRGEIRHKMWWDQLSNGTEKKLHTHMHTHMCPSKIIRCRHRCRCDFAIINDNFEFECYSFVWLWLWCEKKNLLKRFLMKEWMKLPKQPWIEKWIEIEHHPPPLPLVLLLHQLRIEMIIK